MNKRTFLFQFPVEIEYTDIMDLQRIVEMVKETFSENHFQDEETLKDYLTGKCSYEGFEGGFADDN